MQTHAGKSRLMVNGENNLNGSLPLFVLEMFECQVNDFLNEAIQKRMERDLQTEKETE